MRMLRISNAPVVAVAVVAVVVGRQKAKPKPVKQR
jgi:hypothetical protein